MFVRVHWCNYARFFVLCECERDTRVYEKTYLTMLVCACVSACAHMCLLASASSVTWCLWSALLLAYVRVLVCTHLHVFDVYECAVTRGVTSPWPVFFFFFITNIWTLGKEEHCFPCSKQQRLIPVEWGVSAALVLVYLKVSSLCSYG